MLCPLKACAVGGFDNMGDVVLVAFSQVRRFATRGMISAERILGQGFGKVLEAESAVYRVARICTSLTAESIQKLLQGILGQGSGKALEAKSAVDKATRKALRHLTYVPRFRDHTIHYPITMLYGKTKASRFRHLADVCWVAACEVVKPYCCPHCCPHCCAQTLSPQLFEITSADVELCCLCVRS